MLLNGGYGALQLYMAESKANSVSLFADALHNLSDVASIGLPWLAIWLATRPPNNRWSFGGKRSTITTAFVMYVSLILILGWVVKEAIDRFNNPKEVSGEIITIMGVIGISINLASTLLLSRGRDHDLNIKAAWLHQAVDLVSSMAVVAAGVAIKLTGENRIDPVVTIAVSAIIIYAVLGGAWESWRLLNGGTPSWVDTQGIGDYLAILPGVMSIHGVTYNPVSTTEVWMTFHAVVEADVMLDTHDISHELADRFNINLLASQIEAVGSYCPSSNMPIGTAPIAHSHKHGGHHHH